MSWIANDKMIIMYYDIYFACTLIRSSFSKNQAFPPDARANPKECSLIKNMSDLSIVNIRHLPAATSLLLYYALACKTHTGTCWPSNYSVQTPRFITFVFNESVTIAENLPSKKLDCRFIDWLVRLRRGIFLSAMATLEMLSLIPKRSWDLLVEFQIQLMSKGEVSCFRTHYSKQIIILIRVSVWKCMFGITNPLKCFNFE